MEPLYTWAGAKRRLINSYLPYIPAEFQSYYEPFFGGGSMFVHVMSQPSRPKRVIINDVNASIMGIYRAIRDEKTAFVRSLNKLNRAWMALDYAGRYAMFQDVRSQHAFDYQSWSQPREAATLYFLMKTGYNGLWQVNKNLDGRYGAGVGRCKEKVSVYKSEVVEWWHHALQGVEILDGDWQEALPASFSRQSFVFLDPPYRGCKINYEARFTDEDHLTLLDYAIDHRAAVMLCNRDLGDDFFTSRLGGGLQMERLPITYTAGKRKKGEKPIEATETLLWKRGKIVMRAQPGAMLAKFAA